MVTHSSISAWKIPWTEEPGGLQSMGLQRVPHDWATEHTYIHILGGHYSITATPKQDSFKLMKIQIGIGILKV